MLVWGREQNSQGYSENNGTLRDFDYDKEIVNSYYLNHYTKS